MPVEAAGYFETEQIVQWLDVDPARPRDAYWINWARIRPYAYVPELPRWVSPHGTIDYTQLLATAHQLQRKAFAQPHYTGLIRPENITVAQAKCVTGEAEVRGAPRPIRLDKVMCILYGLNSDMEEKGREPIQVRVFLSAYNIKGLRTAFLQLPKEKQDSVVVRLTARTEQSSGFIGEFLWGNRATIDIAIAVFEELCGEDWFRKVVNGDLEQVLQSPGARHSQAARGENFATGRLASLPSPYARPTSEPRTFGSMPSLLEARDQLVS